MPNGPAAVLSDIFLGVSCLLLRDDAGIRAGLFRLYRLRQHVVRFAWPSYALSP
jgi:hypothetical protein